MPNIIAIDPGTEEGAYVVWDLEKKCIVDKNVLPNDKLLNFVATQTVSGDIFCEMIACYGMPVGKETFDTCVWIGRAMQITLDRGGSFTPIFRQKVKLHHCMDNRAKDANIRQAVLNKYGPVGTKKSPGPLYGVASHVWSALAIATYVAEKQHLVTKGIETY
jgi:hypothetical protein